MHGTVKEILEVPTLPAQHENPELAGDAFDLRSVLGLVRRHKRSIFSAMLVVVALSALVTSQLDKRYTATALLRIDAGDAQLLGFEPNGLDGGGGNGLVDTEVEVARSSTVLNRAIDQLGLATWPDFAAKPSLFERLAGLVGLQKSVVQPAPGVADVPSESERARLAKRLSERLDISRRALTSIIAISATAASPGDSARIANAVADAYLNEQLEAKVDSTQRAAGYLRSRVDNIAGTISSLQSETDAFITQKLSEVGSPEVQALVLKLAGEARQRDQAATNLAAIQAALRSESYDRLTTLAGTAALSAERKQIAAELASGDAGQLVSAKERLAALDRQIASAGEQQASQIQSEISAADKRTADLRTQLDTALSQQQLPKDFSVELFRLEHDLMTQRSLYDSFQTKLAQVEQQTDFNIPDSRVIASAVAPDRESFPPLTLIAVATLALALFAGLGLAFLREHFIGGVNSVEQLENVSGIPVIVSVPRVAASAAAGGASMATISQPLSAFAEAIRRLRFGVDALAPKGKMFVFVTSPLPGDGKTTVALALSRQLAVTGTKTLLIDADMRHPAVHQAVGQQIDRGLIDLLAQDTGSVASSVNIIKETASGIDIIFGASASAVATDSLLMSSRFAELMSFARENYDAVVIDTPPIGLIVDASIVARYCDVGIFVVRYAWTSQNHIRSSLRDLFLRPDLPLCGVLNQTERSLGYAYGYDRKYEAYYR